jgi:hypothetical protein
LRKFGSQVGPHPALPGSHLFVNSSSWNSFRVCGEFWREKKPCRRKIATSN